MAQTNADGVIVLSTKVDSTGLKLWTSNVTKQINQATKEARKFGNQAQQSADKATSSFNALGSSLKNVASGLGIAFSISTLIQFSKESANISSQTEASVQRLVDIYGSASNSIGDFIDRNSSALGMSKAAAASFSAVYGNLFGVWADQATNAELTTKYLRMTAVVSTKTGRTVEDVQERIRSGLLGNTEAIEDLGIFVNVKTIEMTDAFKRMANGKSWEQLDAYEQQQVRTLAILEQATSKYGDTVLDTTITTKNEFNAAYQDFQSTWGEFVNKVLMPILDTLTEILKIATKGMNALLGKSGNILENVNQQEKLTNDIVNNIEDEVKAQKDLNDELNKTLAKFDDIQILGNTTDTKEKAQTEPPKAQTEPDASSESGGVDGEQYVDEINGTLAAIMLIASASLVALGLILLFAGNVGWGIGCIITGVTALGVTMSAVSGFDDFAGIVQMLTTIMGIAGGFLLALGIILLWLGGIVGKSVAIGMIIAGALLIIGAVVLQAGLNPGDIKAWLSLILGVAAGAFLALGVILCCVGSVPIGVALLGLGALALIGAFALNPSAILSVLRGPLGVIMAIIGGALLVIGIILVCTGIKLLVGIALIAIGAVALAAAVVANWGAIVQKIKGILEEWGGVIAAAGAALIVLGIILCCTGVGLGLGIGLIVAGAVALVTPIAVNWNAITDWFKKLGTSIENVFKSTWNAIVNWFKSAWNSIKNFWNKSIAPIFTSKFWLDLAKKCGNGLINGFESAINGIIGLFEKMINWVVGGLNKISFDVPNWVPGIGGKKFGFNIPEVKFGRVSIPRLAEGRVIPANREFLAVLGDQKSGVNIETPLATMIDAFNTALDKRGGGGDGTVHVHVHLDGKEIYETVVKKNRENTRITGINEFAY